MVSLDFGAPGGLEGDGDGVRDGDVVRDGDGVMEGDGEAAGVVGTIGKAVTESPGGRSLRSLAGEAGCRGQPLAGLLGWKEAGCCLVPPERVAPSPHH